MAKQILNNGETGLLSRTKINDNFTEVYDKDTAQDTSIGNNAAAITVERLRIDNLTAAEVAFDNAPTSFVGTETQSVLEEIDTYMTEAPIRFEAKSFIDQAPVALDTPVGITFGGAQTTTDISIDAAGVVTFNTPGTYFAQIDMQFGRAGSAGVAYLYIRSKLNGVASAPSFIALLDSSDVKLPFNQTAVIPIPVGGITLDFEMYRDSAGVNEGGLYSDTPTLAGWNDTCSCRLVIVKEH